LKKRDVTVNGEGTLKVAVCGTGCGPVVRRTAERMRAVRENGRRSGRVLHFKS